MGRPLIKSYDSLVTYPFIKCIVNIFKDIHPIYITIANIFIKILSLIYLNNFNVIPLFITLLLERFLDCLDGEVARKFNKCTNLGHYMDKYSDVIYRLLMGYICFNILLVSNISIYWIILLVFNIVCPLTYIIDYFNNNLNLDMVSTKNGYSIYVEDNATLLCFILPYIIYKLK